VIAVPDIATRKIGSDVFGQISDPTLVPSATFTSVAVSI
jgi:hypothetical protein